MTVRKHAGVRSPKREIEWDGRTYKVRRNSTVIPDLQSLPRMEALIWLCRETCPRGFSKPNPLAGYGGAISVGVRP